MRRHPALVVGLIVVLVVAATPLPLLWAVVLAAVIGAVAAVVDAARARR